MLPLPCTTMHYHALCRLARYTAQGHAAQRHARCHAALSSAVPHGAPRVLHFHRDAAAGQHALPCHAAHWHAALCRAMPRRQNIHRAELHGAVLRHAVATQGRRRTAHVPARENYSANESEVCPVAIPPCHPRPTASRPPAARCCPRPAARQVEEWSAETRYSVLVGVLNSFNGLWTGLSEKMCAKQGISSTKSAKTGSQYWLSQHLFAARSWGWAGQAKRCAVLGKAAPSCSNKTKHSNAFSKTSVHASGKTDRSLAKCKAMRNLQS